MRKNEGKNYHNFSLLMATKGKNDWQVRTHGRAEVLLSVCALRNSIHIYLETAWSLRSLREKNKGII